MVDVLDVMTDQGAPKKDSTWREEAAALRAEVQQIRADVDNRAAIEVNNLENIYCMPCTRLSLAHPSSRSLRACTLV